MTRCFSVVAFLGVAACLGTEAPAIRAAPVVSSQSDAAITPVATPVPAHGFELDAVAEMKPDDAGASTGSATIHLSFEQRGVKKIVDIDRIELHSNGALGAAELFTFDADGTILSRKPADLSERHHGLKPKKDALHRPNGTVASAGVIYHGERAWYLYYVYHVVRVGERSYQVVRQGFHSASDERRPEDDKLLTRLDL